MKNVIIVKNEPHHIVFYYNYEYNDLYWYEHGESNRYVYVGANITKTGEFAKKNTYKKLSIDELENVIYEKILRSEKNEKLF